MTTLNTIKRESTSKAVDPVCGMDVEPGKTKLVSVYKDHSYWFCAEGCRRAFEANPEKYLDTKPSRKKGLFGRFLDRMAKTNEKAFGCAGPRCH